MKKQLCVIICLILCSAPFYVKAQVYKVSHNSKVTIVGTSTMHDWESIVEHVTGKGTFIIKAEEVKEIKDLNLKFAVKSIESGKSLMNKLTDEALKEKQHPAIIFNLSEVKDIRGNAISAIGQLSIAGKTNTVDVRGKATPGKNTITINGEYSLNMRDYDIEPPTAMLGTIKVGETVTIKYNLILTK